MSDLNLRKIDVIKTNCNFCSESNGDVIYKGIDIEFETCSNEFSFIRCNNCRHIYLNPMPALHEFDQIYENYLTVNTQSAYYPSRFVAYIKDNIFDKNRIKNVTSHLKKESNVLDIGAGACRLLKKIKRMVPYKINLYANEISYDDNQKKMIGGEGINILEGAIENLHSDLKFDLILGIHVIEHVIDPQKTFEWISNHLNPGGMLYFETPDADALISKLFKNNWGMLHFPRHLNLFSKSKLKKLAIQSGMSVRSHKNVSSAPAWNMSIRNLCKLNALKKHKSIFEIFNYSNPLTLTFFTLVDFLLLLFNKNTSSQQLIAIKHNEK